MLTEPWRIRMLGGLRATQAGVEVARFRTHKTAELLAYLAFHAGKDHPRERLMDVLWPDSGLDAARNSLSVALNSLRRQFEPPVATPGSPSEGSVVVADRSTVRLRPGTFSTDVADFEAGWKAGAANEDPDALEAALAHYGGDLLPGFDSDWVFVERERLADARRGALLRLASLLLQRHEAERALDHARAAVQADPLDEEARRLLMRALAAAGRPAAAAAEQLSELERLLEEAGMAPPSGATRELARRLAEGADKGVGGGERPPVRAKEQNAGFGPADSASAAAPAPRLPAPLNRFFGREEEIGRIGALLGEPEASGPVTLTGTGGAGKTRLALEAARRWSGNATFVPLADVAEPSRLFEAVRDALALPRVPGREPLEQVAECLNAAGPAAAPRLLVLDNLEHLLGGGPLDPAGAASAVRTLLARCAHLRVLATSREPLGLDGERVVAVPPLPVPEVEGVGYSVSGVGGDRDSSGLNTRHPALDTLLSIPSVALFVDRARSRRPDFQLTPRNAEAVARLCARLEGLPLAVELAAARSKLFTPAQILERLEAGFADLESRRPDVPARHRSLYGAAAWSYDLLSAEAKRVFAGLSVFRGGCTVPAAVAVCGDGDGDDEGEEGDDGATLEILARLRDASLIVSEDVPLGSDAEETRLRLLEPLREFAAERLTGEERERREGRHARFFAEYVRRVREELRQGGPQDRLLDRLDADRENLRAVVSRPQHVASALSIAGKLNIYWQVRGYHREAMEWIHRVLEADDSRGAPPTLERGWVLNIAGNLACERGEHAEALRFYAECRALYQALGHRRGESGLLLQMGNLAHQRNDYEEARRCYEERLARLREEGGPPTEIAYALGSLGNVAQSVGDLPRARALQEEALAILEAAGDAQVAATVVHNLGLLAADEGDLGRARALQEEALRRRRGLKSPEGVAFVLTTLGRLDLREGEPDAARARFAEALPLALEVGVGHRTLDCLDGFARHAARTGRSERAARLWGAVEAHAAALDVRADPADVREQAEYIEEARRGAPSRERFEAAWREGRSLSLDGAARLALDPLG